MVRAISGHDVVLDEVKYVEYYGLSTDEKPTTFGTREVIVDGEKIEKTIAIATGSIFIEIDSGNVYMFDEENINWALFGGSSGGDKDFLVDEPGQVLA